MAVINCHFSDCYFQTALHTYMTISGDIFARTDVHSRCMCLAMVCQRPDGGSDIWPCHLAGCWRVHHSGNKPCYDS